MASAASPDGNEPAEFPLPPGIDPDEHGRRDEGGGGDRQDNRAFHAGSDGTPWGQTLGLTPTPTPGNILGDMGSNHSRTVLNFMQTPISGGLVKNAGAVAWSEVDTQEAALIARCNTGDEGACADLVSIHQRMVYSLALHLLQDRDEALDLSQEVFLRVFRTLSSFRGQSALRTWIYRIVINQARNRQRWWRRRHRSSQVSLDEHLQQFGDVESKTRGAPGPAAGQQGDLGAHLAGARSAAVRPANRVDPS